MTEMNVLLVRHGEIPSNVNKVYAGTSPEGLTPNGLIQAEEVAEKLKFCNVHFLYSSPIQRAGHTAEIIGKKIHRRVVIEDDFREMELGPWEGLAENDIAQKYKKEWEIWQNRPYELKLPGRETLEELLKRVLTAISKIYIDAAGHNVVIVTHVAIIRVLLLWHAKKSLGLYKTIHVPNAEIFEMKINSFPDR